MPSFVDAGAHISERDHQGHWIERRWIESEASIKRSSIDRNGMDQYSTNPNHVGGLEDPSRSILKECPPESSSLMRLDDR